MGIQPPGPYAHGVLIPQWFLISASFIVIAARLNLRVRIQRIPLMASDILMCCAWLSAVVTASFDIVFARMGVLRPNLDYFMATYKGPPEDVEYVQKLLFVSQFPFDLTLYLARAALLAVYLRMFPIFMPKRRFILWLIIAYCAAGYTVTVLTNLFICRPVESNWSLDPEVACDWQHAVADFFVCWSLHFSSDVLIFLLPFMVLGQLRLQRSLKVGIYCTFLLGIINIVFSLTRFLALYDSTFTHAPSLSLVELWCALDCNISVLIGCLPSLRPYFRSSLWSADLSTASSGVSCGPSSRIARALEAGNGRTNEGAAESNASPVHPPTAKLPFSQQDYSYIAPCGTGRAAGLRDTIHQQERAHQTGSAAWAERVENLASEKAMSSC